VFDRTRRAQPQCMHLGVLGPPPVVIDKSSNPSSRCRAQGRKARSTICFHPNSTNRTDRSSTRSLSKLRSMTFDQTGNSCTRCFRCRVGIAPSNMICTSCVRSSFGIVPPSKICTRSQCVTSTPDIGPLRTIGSSQTTRTGRTNKSTHRRCCSQREDNCLDLSLEFQCSSHPSQSQLGNRKLRHIVRR
jgi:hypothetical protein